MDLIYKLNTDHRIDGLLVQLPLPGTDNLQSNRKTDEEYRDSCTWRRGDVALCLVICKTYQQPHISYSFKVIHTVHTVVLTVACLCSTDHIDERTVCNAVSPTKDVDGFHVVNVGRMCLDQSTMLPATPWGVWEIIKRTGR